MTRSNDTVNVWQYIHYWNSIIVSMADDDGYIDTIIWSIYHSRTWRHWNVEVLMTEALSNSVISGWQLCIRLYFSNVSLLCCHCAVLFSVSLYYDDVLLPNYRDCSSYIIYWYRLLMEIFIIQHFYSTLMVNCRWWWPILIVDTVFCWCIWHSAILLVSSEALSPSALAS